MDAYAFQFDLAQRKCTFPFSHLTRTFGVPTVDFTRKPSLKNGSTSLALATMNIVPLVILDEQENEDIMFPVSSTSFLLNRISSEPGHISLDPDLEAEFRLRDEAAALNSTCPSPQGRDCLESLTATLMFPPKGRPWQATSIGERLRARAYSILVGIVNKMGWDAFLDLRGEVFIMQSDVQQVDSDFSFVREQALKTEKDASIDILKYYDIVSVVCKGNGRGSENRRLDREESKGDAPDVHDESLQREVGECGDRNEPTMRTDENLAQNSLTPAASAEEAWTRIIGNDTLKERDDRFNRAKLNNNILDGVQQEVAAMCVLRGEMPSSKQLCNVWLDEIIDALYDDLSEFMEWRLTVGICTYY
mmetsp:Transcript_4509/g.11024  ORF Transcript_4509/g.11024 Transcript_4509/m.11024 type:complete len:362 (+) Transcript_4509:1376-2461(+)